VVQLSFARRRGSSEEGFEGGNKERKWRVRRVGSEEERM